MNHNDDMIKLVKLLEGQQKYAGEEVGQKPGDQVRGTDKAKTSGKDHPFKGRLVGEDTTLEDRLAKKYQDFKELQAKEKAEKKEKEELDEQDVTEGFLDSIFGGGTAKTKPGQLRPYEEYDGFMIYYDPESQLFVTVGTGEFKGKFKARGFEDTGNAAFYGEQMTGGKRQNPIRTFPRAAADHMRYEATDNNVAEAEPVRIGSKLPQSDIETFGLEKGRGYKINNPKDWKPGDRPRAVQQLIPTQDKKDHIRSRLGKHKSPVLPEQDVAEGMNDSPVAGAITRRIMLQRTDLLSKYGPEKVLNAIDEVTDFVGDVEEIGSSDVSGWVRHVEQMLGNMEEGMTVEQKLSELGATPPTPPAGTATATAAPTTGNTAPTSGSVSPDEQTALNKIQTNPAMKQQLDKLMTQAKPAQTGQPMKLNPDQEDALEKIKANAGLKTQYDKIIQQANPQAKV